MIDERKEFESMVKATWGDTYSFTQDEDEHYCDFVLDAMWWGWQARVAEQEKNVGPSIKRVQAEALESVCRSYAPYGLSNSYTAFAVSQNLEAEANRLRGEAAKMEYTHPASADDWIKCSERLPDVLDVWVKMTDGSIVACWSKLDGDFYWNGGGSESYILENTVTHWKPRQQEKDQ